MLPIKFVTSTAGSSCIHFEANGFGSLVIDEINKKWNPACVLIYNIIITILQNPALETLRNISKLVYMLCKVMLLTHT